MKLKFLFIIFLSLLFFSCKSEPSNWVIVSLDNNDNTNFYNSRQSDGTIKTWVSVKVGDEIKLNLSLLPESDKYIDVAKVYSTNPTVVGIGFIDLNSRKITVNVLSIGEAEVVIKTKSFGSCASPTITVK